MAEETPSVGLVGRVKKKLIATKEQWAESKRHQSDALGSTSDQRLPPGQHIVKNWPVLDLGILPDIDLATWRLSIEGLVSQQISLSLADFLDLPNTRSKSDIHCVTTWSLYDNLWDGVSVAHLLEQQGLLPTARYATIHCYDGYTTNLALEDLMRPGALLVSRWEGQPLEREHGGPVRLVVPHLYFWKSAKWVRTIEITDEDTPGFWEQRGYHNRGNPWKEERYD